MPSERTPVLPRDPDLAAGLTPEEFASARSVITASLTKYPKGLWSVAPDEFPRAGSLGMLIVDGLLVRKVSVGSRACAELLGPGDILQPWLRVSDDSSVSLEVNWNVVEHATLALLDREFAQQIGAWPDISATIATRIMTRTHWLAFHLAVCHIRRVEERLLLVLWHTADRWGRMTPRGAEISIALPHSLLGFMIGARRPAVTLALQQLIGDGTVERKARSRWILHGEPPTAYRRATSDAAHRRLQPCAGADAES